MVFWVCAFALAADCLLLGVFPHSLSNPHPSPSPDLLAQSQPQHLAFIRSRAADLVCPPTLALTKSPSLLKPEETFEHRRLITSSPCNSVSPALPLRILSRSTSLCSWDKAPKLEHDLKSSVGSGHSPPLRSPLVLLSPQAHLLAVSEMQDDASAFSLGNCFWD